MMTGNQKASKAIAARRKDGKTWAKTQNTIGILGIVSLLSYTAMVFNAVLGVCLMRGQFEAPGLGK